MPETFDVMEQDDRPLSRRQVPERGAQPRSQVGGLPRITELRCQALGQLVRVSDLAPPRNVEGRVGYYTVQPSPKRLVWSETVQCAIGVQKSLLHRIFGILVGGDD
jgi:hypothetical protein